MKIPKVDEGIKKIDYEDLQSFYRRCNVFEYVYNKGGKVLSFQFEHVFNDGRQFDKKMTNIEITKKSFLNNINVVLRYINYFIEYFDDDNELMMSYLYLMFNIMNTQIDLDPPAFIDILKSYLANSSMIDKICDMIEYNTDKDILKKPDKKYDESIQLTVEHLKAIMGISCIHKFIIPIVSHYYMVRKEEIRDYGRNVLKRSEYKERDLYFEVFTAFIDAFDKRYDIDLYSKLYHTAVTRISKTENKDSLMWKRREQTGVTPVSYSSRLMRDLFVDISQKVIFDKSAIIFIHVCFDGAIKNELRQQDKYEYSDMDMISDNVNEEGSRFDKCLINNSRCSEKIILRANIVIRDMLQRKAIEHNIDFHSKKIKKEILFYEENLGELDEGQLNLIFLYFSPVLHSYEVVRHIKIKHLIKMIMIMKRELKACNYIYLPQLISGNSEKIKAFRCNRKRIEKLFINHPNYDELLVEYNNSFNLINKIKVLDMVKSLVSCPLQIVDYDEAENLGRSIEVNEAVTVDEIVRFILAL